MNGIEVILIIIVAIGGIIGISLIITKILNHFFDLDKFENKLSGIKDNNKLSEKALIITEMINNKNHLDLLKYEKSQFLDMLMELDYSFLSKINRNELNNVQKTLFYCILLEDAVQADSIINLLEDGIIYDELKDISDAYKEIGATKTSNLVNKLKDLLNNYKDDIDSENIAFLENEELYKKVTDIDNEICDYPDGIIADIYYNYFYNEEKINELFNFQSQNTNSSFDNKNKTIIIKLDSKKLDNPDLDILYILPEKIKQATNNIVLDNGYDYLTDTELLIFFKTNDLSEISSIYRLFKEEKICNNDLSKCSEMYYSNEENANIDNCIKVDYDDINQKKQATVFETGGRKPTKELYESWIGQVGWQNEEDKDIFTKENFTPLAMIFLENLPYVPQNVSDIKLINVFIKEDIWEGTDGDITKYFLIRTYKSLDNLEQCEYKSSSIKPFPLFPKLVEDDTSMDDLEGKKYYNHKVGGFETFCQEQIPIEDGYEFVFQIVSDEKAELNIVDSGNFYFYYNKGKDKWKVEWDFY